MMKTVHLIFATLTIGGFILRGIWMMRSSPWLDCRATRIAPHVIDTLFLLSGIALVLQLKLAVMQNPWLLAKFVGLFAYIVLGAMALRRGPTMRIRIMAFAGALLAFAYIVGAALTKSPLSWASRL